MAAIHTALQSVVKYFKIINCSRVNDVELSQVQYKFLFGAMLACASLSSLKSWYSTIDCAVSEANMVDKKYVEEWCYANSTFLVKDAENGFGIGNEYSRTSEGAFRLGYYQWVTFALLIQAACFQIPRIIWKVAEGGRACKILGKLPDIEVFTLAHAIQIEDAARMFVDEDRQEARRNYFFKFALCQSMYFVNALFQIYFTQVFLYDEFLYLLPAFMLGNSDWNRVFPKLVKCKIPLYFPTGSSQTMDVVCVLAMNTLFEKLYLSIWIVLATALLTATAQNLYVFVFMNTTDDKNQRSASDRLLLKFVEQSLDRPIYVELIQQISREEIRGV